METEILKVIVDGSTRYFNRVGGHAPFVHPPFLASPESSPVDDFSAVIGISGRYRGCVYLTASRVLLQSLLGRLGEQEGDDRLCADLVGEICNTIAGNAREQLGSGFMISVPFLLKGKPGEVQFPKGVDCYVIPIEWGRDRARLVVAIKPEEES